MTVPLVRIIAIAVAALVAFSCQTPVESRIYSEPEPCPAQPLAQAYSFVAKGMKNMIGNPKFDVRMSFDKESGSTKMISKVKVEMTGGSRIALSVGRREALRSEKTIETQGMSTEERAQFFQSHPGWSQLGCHIDLAGSFVITFPNQSLQTVATASPAWIASVSDHMDSFFFERLSENPERFVFDMELKINRTNDERLVDVSAVPVRVIISPMPTKPETPNVAGVKLQYEILADGTAVQGKADQIAAALGVNKYAVFYIDTERHRTMKVVVNTGDGARGASASGKSDSGEEALSFQPISVN